MKILQLMSQYTTVSQVYMELVKNIAKNDEI